jgi:type IV secretion system protein TrbJ
MNRRLRRALAAGAAGALLAVPVASVRADWIVFDPHNFEENVLTAARELQQVNNEIQSLENQARNLASLPFSALQQLEQSIAQTEQLLAQAQNIAYSVTAINQAFANTYPQSYPASTSAQQLFSDAQTRWQNALVIGPAILPDCGL